MLSKMFLFEWRYFTRQPSFYVSAIIFFSMAFFATGFPKLESLFGSNVFVNGPYFIAQIMGILTFFSLFLVVNFVANTAMRDQSTSMAEILYCKPINPLSYQLGRFLGSFAVVITVFSVVPLGLLLGSLMPWLTESRLGPINLNYYLTTFVYISLPTIFVFACLFYAIAIRLKSMMAVYLTVIAIFILNEISDSLFLVQDARSLASLLDPFALRTFAEVSRYWTVFEKNNQMLTFAGVLLENRLLWITIGVAMMIVFGRFTKSLVLKTEKVSNKKSKKTEKCESIEVKEIGPQGNAIHYKGYQNTAWQHFLLRTLFEIKQVIFKPSFMILCSFIFLVMIAVLNEPKGMFGSTNLPFTQIMVQVIRGSMAILSTIIITYYSAEAVWRERSSGMGDIIDSMPVSNLSFWLSKMVAVWLVLILLLCFGMAIGLLFQIGNGFSHFEFSQYLTSLFYVSALPWMMLTVLAFLLQIISPNKYAGMFLFVLFVISGLVMEPLGLGHNMFRFSKSPAIIYSDLNGYGWSLLSHSWYMLYWGALSIVMSIIGYGLWQRGTAQNLKLRAKNLAYQIGSKGKLTLVAACLVFIFSGSNIYYNTRVINQHMTQQDINETLANYEKQYSQYAEAVVPIITKMNAAVDIYPEQRKVEAKVKILVNNKSSKPIERFLVAVSDYTPIEFSMEIKGGKLGEVEGELNTRWFEFDQPLLPGEQRNGSFHLIRHEQGFKDKDAASEIVQNGTFFNNTEMFPMFGYQHLSQISDAAERSKQNLPPAKRAHKIDESAFYQQNIMGPSSGHLEFETTVSTSVDQIAIAPGYLQKEWTEGKRRYFHYKMDAPIENYFAYLSARFETLKSSHDGVDIEIYYHKGHAVNIDRMMQGVKDSIDYFSANFGGYQHRQARIIEFPGYRNFAQSFPNTIAYSERIGFITDMRNEDEIDQIYYVTAHEMAHQWWGGQVDGANVQGSTMIVETLAQYSALMLTEKKYGQTKLRGILKLELDRYLRGRTNELVEELPLMLVENQQYIHYRKGAVAMMSLVDLLGETRMNKALSDFLAKFKFSEDPYPTTLDLMSFVSQDASEEESGFIRSIFEQINLYDLKTKNVAVKELENQQFEVSLTIDARRINADGQGVETEVALSEMIDIGLFMDDPDDISNNNKPLYLNKHMITAGENIIKVIVEKRPAFAGIDPYVKLIDRDSADNIYAL